MIFFKNYLTLKRVFDILLSYIGLISLSGFWFLFSFLIRLQDRGPIFYLQERVGKNGGIFKSIKFRSMIPGAEKNLGPVQAERDDPRQTKIGGLLRKTALDELPQLINILKGEMSFVGPRALRPAEIESTDTSPRDIFQIPGFPERSSIRPGLTGLAQVFAPRKLKREEKFRYDLWYVEKMNLWLDIRLIAMSFLKTAKARWDI